MKALRPRPVSGAGFAASPRWQHRDACDDAWTCQQGRCAAVAEADSIAAETSDNSDSQTVSGFFLGPASRMTAASRCALAASRTIAVRSVAQ